MIGRYTSESACPALCRASTSFLVEAEDVDGRDICAKTRFALLPGHDEIFTVRGSPA
jgi:hypothetical protein